MITMTLLQRSLVICCVLQVSQALHKSTWAASDPKGDTKAWLLRYLPVYSSNNSCDNGNNTCKCGAAGRMEVLGTTGFEPEFGIHTVLAKGADDQRLKASGHFNLSEIEEIWTREIGDLGQQQRGYSSWLDNHLAFWTPSLENFVERFEADDVRFRTSSWRAERSVFYSLIVHIPKSQVVLEFISNATGGRGHWPLQREARHIFQVSPPPTKLGYLFPLHVSRAVRDLEEVRRFYSKVFNISARVQKSYEDGTEVLVFGGVPEDTFAPRVGLQFVMRKKAERPQRFSATWFQEYMLNVSKTYMTSYKSCWPVWGDNHIAVRPTGLDLKAFAARLDSLETPMYHAFHGIKIPGQGPPKGGPSVIYVVDPSGWTVQVEGHWPDGFLPDADTDNGNFYEYCYDPQYGQGCRKPSSLIV